MGKLFGGNIWHLFMMGWVIFAEWVVASLSDRVFRPLGRKYLMSNPVISYNVLYSISLFLLILGVLSQALQIQSRILECVTIYHWPLCSTPYNG